MTTPKKKNNGLAAFSQKTTTATATEPKKIAGKRTRGRGESVSITVRLPKNEWMKLQIFAMSEGISLQSLAVSGFNRELAAKGQPLLDA